MRAMLDPQRKRPVPDEPPLCNGDRMKQPEFHRRYEAYPDHVKIELIGGTVYMASPLRRHHAQDDEELGYALAVYRRGTPGTERLPNATAILGEESEPQPDQALRILPEYGGQSWETEDNYLQGPPELLAEIAYSTRALDLHQKRTDYDAAGVVEYLVLCVEERELHWFNFKLRRLLKPDAQGIYRSRVFPGLWIDGPALLARDSARIEEVVRQGLASPEHAAFVKRLQAAYQKRQRRRRST